MADKKQPSPGVKPTAEPGDEPATTTQPADTTMDANSAAVDAYRHPLAPAPEGTTEAVPASGNPASAPTGNTDTSAKES